MIATMAHDMYPIPDPPLGPDLMLRAYAAGIFPMSDGADDPRVFWVDPQIRGVMPLDGFRISRSLARRIRAEPFRVTVNADFAGVVAGCADREPTWINADLARVYGALHAGGFAHAVEVWDGPDLAGGIFGITIGAAFFGESMFSRRRDASKIAMAYLIARLRAGGFTLFDTQFVTDHLVCLGGVEIPRLAYRAALSKALTARADFLALPDPTPVHDVLHLRTQTS